MSQLETSFISIDSRKRQSGEPEDLVIYLDRPIQNVKRVLLEHFSAYNTIYNVTSDNNVFSWNDGSVKSIMVTPGLYTSNEFISALSTAINAVSAVTFTLTYNVNTMKLRIAATGAFSLLLSNPKSCADIVGFARADTGASTSFNGAYVMDLGQPSQLHIYIREIDSSYVSTEGTGDLPAFIVHIDANREQVIDFKSRSAYEQWVDLPVSKTLNMLSINLRTTNSIAGEQSKVVSLNGSEYTMILRVDHLV